VIGWLVVVAIVPPPIPGTPSSDQIVMLVPEAEVMKSVDVEERLLAGWIVAPLPCGGLKKFVVALVPASSCALFQTTNSTPWKPLELQLGWQEKAFAAITSLSLLKPISG